MILDVLRIITLGLSLFFLGMDIAILINHYERPNRFSVIGRIGILSSIIILSSIKLTHRWSEPSRYAFYLILIPSLASALYGSIVYYRHESSIEREAKENKIV